MNRKRNNLRAALLAVCLVAALVLGILPGAEALGLMKDAPSEPMTVSRLLSMMGSRNYYFEEGQNGACLNVQDGKLMLDEVWYGAISISGIEISLDADSLADLGGGRYRVRGSLPNPLNGEMVENDAFFVVENGFVIRLETSYPDFGFESMVCEPETFPVTVAECEYGRVIAEPENAFQDQPVTLRAEPESVEYGLSALSWRAEGSEEEHDILESLRFAMPAAPVTVTPAFEMLEEYRTYAVEIPEFENGRVTADLELAHRGELVTLTVEPDEQYRLAFLGYSVDGSEEEIDITDSRRFAMPAARVTVNAIFELRGMYSEAWQIAAAEAERVQELPYASSGKFSAIYQIPEPELLSEVEERVEALKTAIRVYVESNALAEGYADSENLTHYIVNAEDPVELEPWTVSGEGNVFVSSALPYVDGEKNGEHSYFACDAASDGEYDLLLSQEIELSPGRYIFSAKLRGTYSVLSLTVNGEELVFAPIEGSEGVFGSGWEDRTLAFDVLGDQEVTLGVSMRSSESTAEAACGDFRLAKIGTIQLYAVVTEAEGRGTITADHTDAAETEAVTLSLLPDPGYEIESLSVKAADGTEIGYELIEEETPSGSGEQTPETPAEPDAEPSQDGEPEGDGEEGEEAEPVLYWFTMPAQQVNARAVFSAIPHEILNPQVENGTVRIEQDLQTAGIGDAITLFAEPDEHCVLVELKVFSDGEELELEQLNELCFRFTMPNADVEIRALFRSIRHEIRAEASDNGSITLPEGVTAADEGETVKFSVKPKAHFVLVKVQALCGGEELELKQLSEEEYRFIMPNGDVELRAEYRSIRHAIRVQPSTGGSVTVEGSLTEADEGETVTLTVRGDETHRLKSLEVLSAQTPLEVEKRGEAEYRFTMPNGDVDIRAVFELRSFTLSFDLNGHGEGTGPDSLTVVCGEKAAEPAKKPEAAGYDFDGWYRDREGREAFSFDTAITADTVLYAKWSTFSYQFVESSQTWTKNEEGTLVYTVKRSAHDEWTFERFESLLLDNRVLKQGTDFEVEQGSLVITLNSSYLNTKAVKSEGYELKVKFTDGGEASSTVVIQNPSTSTSVVTKSGTGSSGTTSYGSSGGSGSSAVRTGDENRPGVWIALGVGSLLVLGAAGILLFRRGGRKK